MLVLHMSEFLKKVSVTVSSFSVFLNQNYFHIFMNKLIENIRF